jgi:dihydroneopterin aldolase
MLQLPRLTKEVATASIKEMLDGISFVDTVENVFKSIEQALFKKHPQFKHIISYYNEDDCEPYTGCDLCVFKSDEDELVFIFVSVFGVNSHFEELVVENYLLADSLAPYLQQDILKHIQEEDPKTYERATMKVVDKLIETTSQNRL